MDNLRRKEFFKLRHGVTSADTQLSQSLELRALLDPLLDTSQKCIKKFIPLSQEWQTYRDNSCIVVNVLPGTLAKGKLFDRSPTSAASAINCDVKQPCRINSDDKYSNSSDIEDDDFSPSDDLDKFSPNHDTNFHGDNKMDGKVKELETELYKRSFSWSGFSHCYEYNRNIYKSISQPAIPISKLKTKKKLQFLKEMEKSLYKNGNEPKVKDINNVDSRMISDLDMLSPHQNRDIDNILEATKMYDTVIKSGTEFYKYSSSWPGFIWGSAHKRHLSQPTMSVCQINNTEELQLFKILKEKKFEYNDNNIIQAENKEFTSAAPNTSASSDLDIFSPDHNEDVRDDGNISESTEMCAIVSTSKRECQKCSSTWSGFNYSSQHEKSSYGTSQPPVSVSQANNKEKQQSLKVVKECTDDNKKAVIKEVISVAPKSSESSDLDIFSPDCNEDVNDDDDNISESTEMHGIVSTSEREFQKCSSTWPGFTYNSQHEKSSYGTSQPAVSVIQTNNKEQQQTLKVVKEYKDENKKIVIKEVTCATQKSSESAELYTFIFDQKIHINGEMDNVSEYTETGGTISKSKIEFSKCKLTLPRLTHSSEYENNSCDNTSQAYISMSQINNKEKLQRFKESQYHDDISEVKKVTNIDINYKRDSDDSCRKSTQEIQQVVLDLEDKIPGDQSPEIALCKSDCDEKGGTQTTPVINCISQDVTPDLGDLNLNHSSSNIDFTYNVDMLQILQDLWSSSNDEESMCNNNLKTLDNNECRSPNQVVGSIELNEIKHILPDFIGEGNDHGNKFSMLPVVSDRSQNASCNSIQCSEEEKSDQVHCCDTLNNVSEIGYLQVNNDFQNNSDQDKVNQDSLMYSAHSKASMNNGAEISRNIKNDNPSLTNSSIIIQNNLTPTAKNEHLDNILHLEIDKAIVRYENETACELQELQAAQKIPFKRDAAVQTKVCSLLNIIHLCDCIEYHTEYKNQPLVEMESLVARKRTIQALCLESSSIKKVKLYKEKNFVINDTDDITGLHKCSYDVSVNDMKRRTSSNIDIIDADIDEDDKELVCDDNTAEQQPSTIINLKPNVQGHANHNDQEVPEDRRNLELFVDNNQADSGCSAFRNVFHWQTLCAPNFAQTATDEDIVGEEQQHCQDSQLSSHPLRRLRIGLSKRARTKSLHRLKIISDQ